MEKQKSNAILTGATGGLGYAFLKELCKEKVDEIWAIGRNKKRLEELVKEFGIIIVSLCLDLTKTEDINKFKELLIAEKPIIDFLINNAGITVTAACPSWIDTDMLIKEINGKKVKFKGIVSPEKVAKKAISDAKRGRDMSVCSLYVKCQHLNVKLMPQKLTMKIWKMSVKKYL